MANKAVLGEKILKVILTKDLKGSGKSGDLVNVKDGYAKNFLFPKGFAKPADKSGLSELKSKNEAILFRSKKYEEEAKEIAKKLDGQVVAIEAKVGENGKIFGSVTNKEVAARIKEDFGISLDKRKIDLGEEIKAFGTYVCELKFLKGIKAKIRVQVLEG